MKIKAAVAARHGEPLHVQALDLHEPRDGEVLVRLVASGVAARDRAAIAGHLAVPLPFVPGAEAAGIVERVGAGVAAPVAGDAVLVVPEHRDVSGRRADGSTPFVGDAGAVHGFCCGQSSFATHLVCRAVDVVVLDRNAPLELAAALNGDVLAGAAAVLGCAEPTSGDAVVVTGAGVLGLAACMTAKATGFASIVVAEPSAERRALALKAGATVAVPDEFGLSAVVKSLNPDGARLAVDTTGTAAGRGACKASLAPAGTFVDLAGTSAFAPSAATAAPLLARLLELLERGDLPLANLVSFFPFEHVNDALAAGASGEVAKPVIRFSLGSFGDLDRALSEASALDEAQGEPTSEPQGSASPPTASDPVTA